MEKITLSKRAALACLDVLHDMVTEAYELESEWVRSQVIAYDELISQLPQEFADYQKAEQQRIAGMVQKREQEDTKPEALGEWLRMIFRAGDQDETSWKHLGHGFAALVHFGDWKLAKDYERPWMGSLPQSENALNFWWEKVELILKADREATLAEAERLSGEEYDFGHLTAYLDGYDGAAH